MFFFFKYFVNKTVLISLKNTTVTMPRHAVFKYDCVSVTPWEWRTYRKFFNKSRFLNTAARKQPVVLFMCDGLCYSHKINEKMYLDFRNASILKRGKISLLCPGKKEFVVFQNGGEWLDVLSPFCEMSLYFRPCFGYLWSFYHRKRCLSLLETTIECLRGWRFREFDL